MTIEEKYLKYYQSIPKNTFDEIILLDPTKTENKLGKYTKWLLKLYKNQLLKEEDFYKAKEYLEKFNKYKVKISQKDINRFKNLSDLFVKLKEEQVDEIQYSSHMEEIRTIKNGAEKVYEDSTWLVVIPRTYEASCHYGANTQWCTASRNNKYQYESYSSKGPLYININKITNKKYQFHFETDSFMDENDSSIKYPIYETLLFNDNILNFYRQTSKENYIKLKFRCVGKSVGRWLKVSNGSQYNFIDLEKEEMFFSSFKQNCDIINDYSGVIRLDRGCEIVDRNCKRISDIEFTSYSEMKDGVMKITNVETVNYLTDDLKLISSEWFEDGTTFENGFAVIKKDNKYNYLSKNGGILLKTWVDEADFFRDDNKDQTIVKIGEKWFIIKNDGTFLLENGYEYIYNFENGAYTLQENDKQTFLKKDGTLIVDQWFENCFNFDVNDLAIVSLNGQYNLLTKDGKYVSDRWFVDCFDPEQGYYLVQDKDFNYIDKNGHYLSSTWFESAESFKNNGTAKINDNYLIDTKGNITKC